VARVRAEDDLLPPRKPSHRCQFNCPTWTDCEPVECDKQPFHEASALATSSTTTAASNLGDSPPLSLASAYHLGIGARERSDHSGFEDQFAGLIYDVRIYDNALSESAIQSLLVPPPVLTIQPWTGNQVRISWSIAAAGFTLQQSFGLPSRWADSGLVITVEGNENVASSPVTGNGLFYRLVK